MNEYEVRLGIADSKFGIVISMHAVSFANVEQRVKEEHEDKTINEIKLTRRGVVPHDMSSGTCES